MPVKIRLARHGRKARPFYYIVVADSRAPRDGKFIERIGSYNPVTAPATIELDFDKALDWLHKGAQPTDTARSILSYKGVMMKKHLLEGVKKEALTAEQAEEKFQTWLTEKGNKIQTAKDGDTAKAKADADARLAAETKVSQDRAEAYAKIAADARAEEDAARAAKAAAKAAAEAPKVEAPKVEAPKVEAPAVEAPAEEAKDAGDAAKENTEA